MRKINFELNAAVSVKIIKRSLLLFVVGYILNALWFTTPIENIRISGVLQRIALVYCFSAFLVLWLKRTTPILILCITLLLGYWALVHFTDSYNLTPNAIGNFDAALFGESRIWKTGGEMFDPEGLVGTISAICNSLLGFVTARVMAQKGWKQVFVIGAAMLGLGVVWNVGFPINKALWSSSFVLFTCGMASMTWAILNWIIDVKGYQSWSTFFKVFGTNAIFAYVLSQILSSINWNVGASKWLYANVYGELFPGWLSSLVWSLIVIGLSWIVTYALYRKKIFLKL